MKRIRSKLQPDLGRKDTFLAQLCSALDRSVPGLRTVFLIAGLVAAAAHSGPPADFLFAAGLLFHIAIWFEHWCITERTR
jgi:hypothetical protein